MCTAITNREISSEKTKEPGFEHRNEAQCWEKSGLGKIGID